MLSMANACQYPCICCSSMGNPVASSIWKLEGQTPHSVAQAHSLNKRWVLLKQNPSLRVLHDSLPQVEGMHESHAGALAPSCVQPMCTSLGSIYASVLRLAWDMHAGAL